MVGKIRCKQVIFSSETVHTQGGIINRGRDEKLVTMIEQLNQEVTVCPGLIHTLFLSYLMCITTIQREGHHTFQ